MAYHWHQLIEGQSSSEKVAERMKGLLIRDMDMQQDNLHFAFCRYLGGRQEGMRFVIVGGKQEGDMWKTVGAGLAVNTEFPVLFMFATQERDRGEASKTGLHGE